MIRLFCLAALLVVSCDSITLFHVHLPPKDFSVDTGDWGLAPAQTVPQVPCDGSCVVPVDTAPPCSGGDCTLTCDSGLCAADITVSLSNDYDLANEASGYSSVPGSSLVTVTVDDIFFQITTNTLNLDTPELVVVIGPQTITSASDPAAKIVGTIPVVPAGTTGRIDVVFASDGQANLQSFMDDFKTPFRVIVSGNQTVHGGDATPSGKLVGNVQADAHVSL